MQRRQIDSGSGDIQHLENCELLENRRGSRSFRDLLALDLAYLMIIEGRQHGQVFLLCLWHVDVNICYSS